MALNSKNIPGVFVTARDGNLDTEEGGSLLTQNELDVYIMSAGFVDPSHAGVLRSKLARGLRAGAPCSCNCQISVKMGWINLEQLRASANRLATFHTWQLSELF